MGFRAKEFFPGIYHIEDPLGVCMTLLVGDEQAMLIDTGYGVQNVAAFIKTLTSLPLTVVLTHGHHDHALGACWFQQVAVSEGDIPVYNTYATLARRQKAAEDADLRGVPVDEGYLKAAMPDLATIRAGSHDLGGLEAVICPAPGHTPGSLVVWIPQHQLLLTGDDWNPCTWLFFPEALPVREYRENISGLFNLPFEYVICSHRWSCYPRSVFVAFADGLTDDVLAGAEDTGEGAAMGIHTVAAHPAGDQVLVFDRDKF